MNTKSFLPLAILFAATAASANGGLGIDNVDKHMNSTQWFQTISEAPQVNAQGPLEQFNAYEKANQQTVNTESFRQDYDGQS